MKFYALLIIVLLLSSCSAIKQRSIARDLVDMSDRVSLVCETVELFTAAGLQAPYMDNCREVLRAIKTTEYGTVYDIANCARRFDADTTDFKRCVAHVPGWKRLAKDMIN